MKKRLILVCTLFVLSVSLIALLVSHPVQALLFSVDWAYREYKADMKDKLDVDGCKEDLEALKEYLIAVRNTVEKRDDFTGSFFVSFKNENGKYTAKAYSGDKALTYQCSEDVYTAYKNVLAHASDTAPIVTVQVTETHILLQTIDGTGYYSLVYSPNRNPGKNLPNVNHTKKAGDGWYHVWFR